MSDTMILGLDALPPASPATEPKRLNVGCGRNIREGWVNLDGTAGPGVDVVADLELCGGAAIINDRTGGVIDFEKLPFDDATFDEFLLSHVLEHIRNVYPLMQELYRVAKPNALMTIRVPYGSSDDAWEDQTHVRAYFLQSFGFFGQPYHWKVGDATYGYKADWKAEQITLLIPQTILNECVGGNAQIDFDRLNKRVRHERNIIREMVCTLRKVDPPRPPDRSLVAVPPIKIEAVQ